METHYLNRRPSEEAAAHHRWLGVGESLESDSREAGRAAARQALESRDPKLLLLFCSDAHDLDGLLAAINEESKGAPL